MSVRQAILKQLSASRNHAVERAVEVALRESSPAEQHELAEVLLERNRRSGWVALIRTFNHLDISIQEKLVARPRDLFGPLAETMHDKEGHARENVITIVKRCADARLVYLLAEALMDARVEVRELAGLTLLDAVRRYCDRDIGSETAMAAEENAEIQRALQFGLRNFKNHRQNNVLIAGLIHERRIDGGLWSLFQDPYDDLTRTATVMLRAPTDPSLVRPLLLSLATPLRPAAMAGLAAIESPTVAHAVAEESFRLIDPLLRDAAQGITHLKLLPALRKESPWSATTWPSWLRLIECVGLQPQERLSWLVRMLGDIPAQQEMSAWRICVLRAIADTRLTEAGRYLAEAAARDPDERVARCATRFLLARKVAEWRELIDVLTIRSPYMSVRRLAQQGTAGTTVAAVKSAAVTRDKEPVRTFGETWRNFDKMPPAMQHSTARSAAGDPGFTDQIRVKLQSDSAQDVAQSLRMLGVLPDLLPYRNQIIALCGHPDPRLAAMAVRLIGRLEDPRLRDLLEAAAHHTDGRVRANAIESMEELHIADKSQQLLGMLNSRHNRERANAIKALGEFNASIARECLLRMLADPNPLHRISALWVVSQFEVLNIMRQVMLIARRDPNLRVRKRAAEMLETLSGNLTGST